MLTSALCRRLVIGCVLSVPLIASACRSQVSPSKSLRDSQEAKAREAKNALFSRLSARLMESMQKSTPAATVLVCADEAPMIAASISREYSLRIGRTSLKLRNPKNKAPAWAKKLIATKSSEEAFVPLADGGLGALLPIRMMKRCEACHGDRAKIAPAIADALAQAYPDDQATGFREGDLRGWFWVEVPRL